MWKIQTHITDKSVYLNNPNKLCKQYFEDMGLIIKKITFMNYIN